jgi:hypothetical protein
MGFDHSRLGRKALGERLKAGEAGGLSAPPTVGLPALGLLGVLKPGGVLSLLLAGGQNRVGKVGIAREILAVSGAVNIFGWKVRLWRCPGRGMSRPGAHRLQRRGFTEIVPEAMIITLLQKTPRRVPAR